jgi:hypothetical protein
VPYSNAFALHDLGDGPGRVDLNADRCGSLRSDAEAVELRTGDRPDYNPVRSFPEAHDDQEREETDDGHTGEEHGPRCALVASRGTGPGAQVPATAAGCPTRCLPV